MQTWTRGTVINVDLAVSAIVAQGALTCVVVHSLLLLPQGDKFLALFPASSSSSSPSSELLWLLLRFILALESINSSFLRI